METRSFGRSGFSVSAIGQGTWRMESQPRQAVRALRSGIELGLTHIDTAEMYGTEELVGEAISGRRGRVFLVSKVLPENASYEGTLEACEASLRRLGTDYLDCYLLHWRGRHPLTGTFRAFRKLRAAGKIRCFGVSNFDVPDLEEAAALLDKGELACNQVAYYLEERAIEHAVLPWCKAHGVAVTAYSPFGSGRFPSPNSRGGRVLTEIAAAHGATPRQVALRFLLRHPEIVVIPKAGRPEHVQENAGADKLRLDEKDLRTLEEAFPLGSRPRRLPVI